MSIAQRAEPFPRASAPPEVPSRVSSPGALDRAWGAVGWFGLVLAAIGLSDIAISWYPLAIGNPEWEFGTVAISVGGLPLTTMGFAAILASALARGRSRTLLAFGVLVGLFSLAILAAFLLFLTNVPMALRSAPEAGALTVQKMILRTSVLSVGFFVANAVAAVTAIRHARPKRRN